MAPDDQPHADDPTEADDRPEGGDSREVHDDGAEGPGRAGPAAGSDEEPVESDALVRLRELRERMRSQFDSLHGEIESLRRPPSERSEGTAGAADTAEAAGEAPVDEAAVDAEPDDVEPAAVEMVDEAGVDEATVDAEPVVGGPDEDHEASAPEGLDLAAAGAGVDPGIFYAPAEMTELDEAADARAGDAAPESWGAGQGSAFFDIEAEGWDVSTGPAGAPPPVADGPGAEADVTVEPGSHGLPDWVFGAHEGQPGAPPEVGPPEVAPPDAGPAEAGPAEAVPPDAGIPSVGLPGGAAAPEQWSGTAPWPDAAPLGDAERMFNPAGSGVRRVVTAVLVFALVVALVILVIQLLDDGESTDQGAGARPVAVTYPVVAQPA